MNNFLSQYNAVNLCKRQKFQLQYEQFYLVMYCGSIYDQK